MKILELTTSSYQSKSDYLSTETIAQITANTIYEAFLNTRPFDDNKSHSFTVTSYKRVYINTPEEYNEYIRFVAEALLKKLNLNQ